MIQAAFERTTGLPEDRIINTFHFSTATTPGTLTEIAAAMGMVTNFYTVAGSGSTIPTGTYFSQELTGVCNLKAYRMENPTPRLPASVGSFTFTPTSGAPLPAEVALCLSYKGVGLSGFPASHYRGRLYLGPFMLSGSSENAVIAGDSRPALLFRNNIMFNAATALMAPAAPRWCVFSRVATNLEPVTHLHVDNAWDTQRRRGAKATSRVVADR